MPRGRKWLEMVKAEGGEGKKGDGAGARTWATIPSRSTRSEASKGQSVEPKGKVVGILVTVVAPTKRPRRAADLSPKSEQQKRHIFLSFI